MWCNLNSNSHPQLIKSRLEKIGNIVLCLFVVAALFLTWYRLRFGVDFSDEAFYIAMSYRFALGDKPFVDELSVGQTFAFLIIPFTKLHLWLHGSLDGIVLFMRHLYLVFVCAIAVVVYGSLSLFVRQKVALLTALCCVVFSYFFIPTLSYNTLSGGLLVGGLFSGLYIIQKAVHPYYFLFTGLFFGLAIIAYPPLLMAALLYVAVIVPWLSHRRMSSMIACLTGIVLVGIGVVPLLMQAGSETLAACLEYSTSLGVQGGGFQKVKWIVSTLLLSLPHPAMLFTLLILIGITYYKKPLWCGFLLLLFPLTFMPLRAFVTTSSMMFINYYCLLAPFLALLVWEKKAVRRLFLGAWLPAFVAGLITAWSSGNGAPNASIGWFTGALVTAVLMALVFHELKQRAKAARGFRLVCLQWLPAFVLALFLLQSQFRSGTVYRDDDIPTLTSQVISGPYLGMYTTPVKYAYLQSATRDINQVAHARQTILIYDLFPAGYLLSSARPATPTIWMQPMNESPQIKRNLLVDYYKRHKAPTIVMQMFQTTEDAETSLTYRADDLFNNYIQQMYQPILKRDSYQIMRKQ